MATGRFVMSLAIALGVVWIVVGCGSQPAPVQVVEPTKRQPEECDVIITERHEAQGDPRTRHDGVEFVVCPGQRVHAIGNGWVHFVSSDVSMGNAITIWHSLPDNPKRTIEFTYYYVKNVRVKVSDEVYAGQVLADAWTPPDGAPWNPRVWLTLGVNRDPLEFVGDCGERVGTFAMPVECTCGEALARCRNGVIPTPPRPEPPQPPPRIEPSWWKP